MAHRIEELETELAFFRKQLHGPKRDRPSPEAQLLIDELLKAPSAENDDEDPPDDDGGGGSSPESSVEPADSDKAPRPKGGKKGQANAKRLDLNHSGLEERVVTVAADPALAIDPETGKP